MWGDVWDNVCLSVPPALRPAISPQSSAKVLCSHEAPASQAGAFSLLLGIPVGRRPGSL